MSDCQELEPLLTPYVDGETAAADRAVIDAHLRVCPPCRAAVDAGRAVRALLRARRSALTLDCASSSLRRRCAGALQASRPAAATTERPAAAGRGRLASWPARLVPVALAASLILVVSGAFLYQATSRSSRVMAAELAADHVKCFAANRALASVGVESMIGPQTLSAARRYLAAKFGWEAHLPEIPDLNLEAARPCLYGEGRVAHMMYRYGGRPVSLFMLPGTTRREELLDVMGHEAAIWSANGRTFVLIVRESREETARLAAAIHRTLE